jgi:tetratricopeptide (TPR) repeat protein
VLCACLVLATLALVAPTASAQEYQVRSLVDTRELPSPDQALLELQSMRSIVCPRGPARSGGRRVKKSVALARAQRLLRKRAGRGYRRLLRSKRGKRPAAAEDFAAAAVANKAPGAALAGFLAAAKREPRNPRNLLNASVVLTRIGMPNEALALVAAADRLPTPRRMPMGIGMAALLENSRGVALIALRRYAEAETALRAAIRREPLLSEAKLNLAAARLCRGRVAQAVQPYLDGKRRNTFSDNVSTAGAQARAGDALDLSRGMDGTLPVIHVPQTSQDAVASFPSFHATRESRSQEMDHQYEVGLQAISDGAAALAGVPHLQAQRTGAIITLWNNRKTQRPEIQTVEDRLKANAERFLQNFRDWDDRYEEIRSDCQAQGGTSMQIEACIKQDCIPATQSAHTRWVALFKETDGLARDYARVVHQYATALAANLADERSRRVIIETSRHDILVINFSYVVLEADTWTDVLDTVKDECVQSGGGTAQQEEGDPGLPSGFACPPELKNVKISFKIPPIFSLGVKCEEISLEVSDGPVGPFAQVSYKFGSGSTTLFAGLKAGTGSDFDVGVGVKGGMYMSFDSSGNPTDTGIRVSGSLTFPGSLGTDSATPELTGKMDFSLADTLL